MEKSVEIQILEKISKAGGGVLFFNESFLSYGSPDAVRQALARLVKAGKLERVSTGIYVRPQLDSILGKVTPGIEDIAKSIAKRDKARITPTGIYSLNPSGAVHSGAAQCSLPDRWISTKNKNWKTKYYLQKSDSKDCVRCGRN